MIQENTSETKDSKIRGVAALFNKTELKSFFKTYIFFIFILEVLIFLFCFLCQLEPVHIPFPWKSYYVAAFVIPVGVTFLLGVFVTAFNIYIFGDGLRGGEADLKISEHEGKTNADAHYMGKFKNALNVMRQIPFLAGLLFLMAGVILFPKLIVFFEFLERAGGAVVSHTLIGLLILLGIGTFFGLVWLIMKYRLQKLSMQYQYKRDIVARLGLIITDDNRLINTEGRVITIYDSKNITPIEANPSKTLMLSKRKSYDAYDCKGPQEEAPRD
jgi:hypothetical protein